MNFSLRQTQWMTASRCSHLSSSRASLVISEISTEHIHYHERPQPFWKIHHLSTIQQKCDQVLTLCYITKKGRDLLIVKNLTSPQLYLNTGYKKTPFCYVVSSKTFQTVFSPKNASQWYSLLQCCKTIKTVVINHKTTDETEDISKICLKNKKVSKTRLFHKCKAPLHPGICDNKYHTINIYVGGLKSFWHSQRETWDKRPLVTESDRSCCHRHTTSMITHFCRSPWLYGLRRQHRGKVKSSRPSLQPT